GHWTDETWVDILVRGTEQAPDVVAVVDEESSLTRGELLTLAIRLATYLRSQGIGPGDVVTLIIPNWREFLVIHAALGLIGAVISPVSPRSGATEITHILSSSKSRFVFAAAEHRKSSPWQIALS